MLHEGLKDRSGRGTFNWKEEVVLKRSKIYQQWYYKTQCENFFKKQAPLAEADW